ncbi:HAMP domain-containing sensor histidine kinase [Actinosynnema sp. NPDC023794]
MRRAWPLRRRLLVALVGLCAAGLTAFAVIGVLLLERSLTERADRQLHHMTQGLRDSSRTEPPRDDPELPTDFSVHLYSASGELLWRAPESSPDGPVVPAELSSGSSTTPVTVPDRARDVEWRAAAVRREDGNVLVTAVTLEAQRETVNRLLLIEVAVGALILVVAVGIGRGVVRLGLRPLTRMERTATAIAGGDAGLRVGDTDEHTETGQLGRALNTMLERLGQAMQERERSEQRLRRFVADASHELRTPLTSIRGFAELYRHGPGNADPAVGRILRRVEDEAERMGVMVEDLLLLARLDHERNLDLSEVDLRALTSDVVHDARARHPGRSIALEVPDDEVRVLGDGHRLHQVVANLVGNAATHSPPGTPVRVRVDNLRMAGWPTAGATSVGAFLPSGAQAVLIKVHDDGPGIPDEHMPLLFDRFYRADPSRAPGGTGLGLAISAALVEAHGGRLEVHSAPGRGTTFRVVLPRTGPEDTTT